MQGFVYAVSLMLSVAYKPPMLSVVAPLVVVKPALQLGLPTSIRLGRKNLPESNVLGYYGKITKYFTTYTPGDNVMTFYVHNLRVL